jgi:hypothetical protein
VHSFLELCGAIGFDNPSDLSPIDLFSRFEEGTKNFDQIYAPLNAGQLLGDSIPNSYRDDWLRASSDSF